jgi:hypothetical protein
MRFIAVPIDVDDGTECCALQWSSTLDGDLGSERDFMLDFSDKPPGMRTITVRATDSSGLVAEASVSVTFWNAPPVINLIKPSDGEVLAIGIGHNFRAELFDDSVPLGIAIGNCPGLQWSVISEIGTTSIGTGCTPTATFPSAGSYAVVATYTDAQGAVDTRYRGVTVIDAGTTGSFALSVTSPIEGHAFHAQDRITLAYEINDPGATAGTSYKIKWEPGRDDADMRTFVPNFARGTTIAISDVFPQRVHDTSSQGYVVKLTIEDPARPGVSASVERPIGFLPEVR